MIDALRSFLVLAAEFAGIYLAVSWGVHLIVATVPRQRLRALLAGNPARGLGMALLLGAVTPFCSCSTVPVVAGMASAGVAVPTLTAFLVMSPLVNPATVALLASLVAPWYAGVFVAASAVLALVVAGVMALARVRIPGAPNTVADPVAAAPAGVPSPWGQRLAIAAARAWHDLRKVAPMLAAVAAIGALLHDRVPADALRSVLEAGGAWTIPIAVLLGAPMYASTAVLLPVGATLAAGGVPLGVVTGFLIGATGLSVPEGVMLQRLLGTRYLVVLTTAFVLAAVALAYLVQALV